MVFDDKKKEMGLPCLSSEGLRKGSCFTLVKMSVLSEKGNTLSYNLH